MKKVLLGLAVLSALATSIVAAQAGCNPWCRQVPDGAGHMVTVCTCN
jgi:hypothetical protein